MDILLTHGYFLYEDPKELQVMKPYPPLGILYICSHLRKRGLDAEVFDSTFSSRQELWDLLQQGPPSILGVYANLMTRPIVVEILRVAKQMGWQTVVGGPEPGAYVQEYLAAGADVVVIGEGELTLEELVPALQSHAAGALHARVRHADAMHTDAMYKDTLHKIDGIAFLAPDGSVVRTRPREQIKDIDAQPWPARELIDMSRYVEVWRTHHGMGSVSLITARGCPYHCRWCSHEVFGKTHRRRKPISVADELEWLIDRYQPQMAWMADDVFTIHHGWLFQYAAELKRRGVKLPFECISRADRLNLQVVETLADMGCFRVWIGSESGSQRILDAMERGVTVEQVQTAVTLCRLAGIQTGMFLMWGYEGEETSDIEATVEHVKKTDPELFFTTVAYPIKGTPYFSEIAGRVGSEKPWAEGSDRDFHVRNRHSRAFYRFADQLLRSEVELNRLGHRPDANLSKVSALRNLIAEARAGLQATAAEVEA
jgi:anaerobic magnesium-protoporphyrin IX monomethyl ester cyclase